MFRDLDDAYNVPADAVIRFRQDGFVHLKDVLSAKIIKDFGPIITQGVFDLNRQSKPMEELSAYEKAFCKWRTCGAMSPTFSGSSSADAWPGSRVN